MNRKDYFIGISALLAHAVCANALGDDQKQSVDVFLEQEEGFNKARMVKVATSMFYKALLRDYDDQELFPAFPGSDQPAGLDITKLITELTPQILKLIKP